MNRHGIAIALTGTDKSATLTCSTVRMNNNLNALVLPKHSFQVKEIDLTNTEQVFTNFRKLVRQIAEVVHLQNIEDPLNEVLIPTVLGKSSDSTFQLGDLLDKIIPDSNTYPSEVIATFNTVSLILKNLILDKGNFTRYDMADEKYINEMRKHLESGKDQFNNDLLELKKRLDNKDPDALDKLIQLAEYKAFLSASSIKNVEITKNLTFLAERTFWNDYATSKEKQEKYAVFEFLNWAPEIKEAYKNIFRATLGQPREIYYKLASEPKAPFFVNVIEAMLIDQHKISDGFKYLEDVIPEFNIWNHRLTYLYSGENFDPDLLQRI